MTTKQGIEFDRIINAPVPGLSHNSQVEFTSHSMHRSLQRRSSLCADLLTGTKQTKIKMTAKNNTKETKQLCKKTTNVCTNWTEWN